MRHLPLALSILVLVGLGLWAHALRHGPGEIELHQPSPWPKELESMEPVPAGVALEGTLHLASGEPAVEALVQTILRTEDGRSRVRWSWTDSAGAFRVEDLVDAEAQGFVVLAAEHMPVRFTAAVPGEAVAWTLPEPTGELEYLPELDLGDLEGRVRRDDGELADLEVLLVPILSPDEREGTADAPGDVLALLAGRTTRRARVDASGRYMVDALAAGFYEVHVLPAWGRGGTWPVLGRGVLEHAPGTGRPSFPVVVESAGLSGRVTDRAGEPLAGALVLVTQEQRAWPPSHTGADGTYAVGDLEAGGYRVEALAGDARTSRELTLALGEGRELDLTVE